MVKMSEAPSRRRTLKRKSLTSTIEGSLSTNFTWAEIFPKCRRSNPSVLHEHNYFLNKTTVRELQDAVTQMGDMYDALNKEVQRLSDYRDDVIEKLNKKCSLWGKDVIQVPPKPLFCELGFCRHFLNDPSVLQAFTGFTNPQIFIKFTNTFRQFYDEGKALKAIQMRQRPLPTVEDQIFLVLSRFKLGLADTKELLNLFRVSKALLDRMWVFWIGLLGKHLRRVRIWPRKRPRRIIIDSMRKTVGFIELDCTRFSVEAAKIILGVTSEGLICFVGEPYLGDMQVKDYWGILKLLECGDEIVVDDGFAIENFIADGVHLTKPWTVRNDGVRFEEINAIRNVTERVIRSVEGYGILKLTQPRADSAPLFTICCHLVNFNAYDFLNREIVFD